MHLDEVKQNLQQLTYYIPITKPVAYLDYPLHVNIGDLLIRRGTEQFFLDYGYDVMLRWPAYPLTARHLGTIRPDTTIVLHGGGNFGDLYYSFQVFREMLVVRFPENKIVVLPQTVHFDDESKLRRAGEVFSRHRDIVVFVRDECSKARLASCFGCPVKVMPDMAHQLWNVVRAEEAGRGTLYIFRKDAERTSAPERLFHDERSVDWDDLVSTGQYVMWRLTQYLHDWESKFGRRFLGPDIWALQNHWLTSRAIRSLSRYETIVTDRLHACILGCLLRKKVFFVDNSYGKLTNYYDTWMREVEWIAPANARSAGAS